MAGTSRCLSISQPASQPLVEGSLGQTTPGTDPGDLGWPWWSNVTGSYIVGITLGIVKAGPCLHMPR